MRRIPIIPLLVLVLASPLEGQRLSRWALNAGYNWTQYARQEHHYGGYTVGLQTPLGGPFRLSARYYDQQTSDDWFSNGWGVDLGLQGGFGNRWAEISGLVGASLLAVDDDYVRGGFSPHFGTVIRVWPFPMAGIYGEWIMRRGGGNDDQQTFSIGGSLNW